MECTNKVSLEIISNIPCVYIRSVQYKAPVPPDMYAYEESTLLTTIDEALKINHVFKIVIDNNNVKMNQFDKTFFMVILSIIDKNMHLYDKLLACEVINSSNSLKTIFDVCLTFMNKKVKKKLHII